MDVGGALRNSGSGWCWINDDHHAPKGFAGVEQLADRLRVHYATSYTKVTTFKVDPDEYYSARGLRVGASVGLDFADLFLTVEDPYAIGDYVYFNGAQWVSQNGVFDLAYNGAGALTLTHEPMGVGVSAGVCVTGRGHAQAQAGGLTSTTTTVGFYTGTFGALKPTGAANSGLHRAWVTRRGIRSVPPADPADVISTSGNLWVSGEFEEPVAPVDPTPPG